MSAPQLGRFMSGILACATLVAAGCTNTPSSLTCPPDEIFDPLVDGCAVPRDDDARYRATVYRDLRRLRDERASEVSVYFVPEGLRLAELDDWIGDAPVEVLSVEVRLHDVSNGMVAPVVIDRTTDSETYATRIENQLVADLEAMASPFMRAMSEEIRPAVRSGRVDVLGLRVAGSAADLLALWDRHAIRSAMLDTPPLPEGP